nr:ABC transporter permease [Rhizobium sp. Q54]
MMRNGPLALVFHAVFVAFTAAPLVAVMLVSFTDKGYMAMPFSGASLRWYVALIDAPHFLDAFVTSLWLGAISASLSLLLSLPAALAISRYRFVGRDAISAALLSPLLIPHVVLGVAFLRFFTDFGINGTPAGLVAAHALIITPYCLRLCLSAANSIDERIEQAAVSLGAKRRQVFTRITLRLILPGIVSGWVLAFIHSFDEVTMSAFLASPSLMPLPVALYHRIEDSIDPSVAAMSSLLIVMAVMAMVVIDRVYGLSRVFTGSR